MKKLIFLTTITCSLIAIKAATAEPIDTFNFHNIDSCPLPAVGFVDYAPALAINPGGIGWQDNIDLYLSKSISGLNQINAYGCLGIANIGFQKFSPWSAAAVTPGSTQYPDIQKYSAGVGYPLLDGLQAGITYNYNQILYKDNTQNLSSFDAGILYRPSQVLSLGLVLRNINQPSYKDIDKNQDVSINRVYSGGLGLRPFGDKLTFTLDAFYKEGDPPEKISGFAGFEAEPFDGFLLNGRVNLDGSFSVGLGMNLSQVGLGYYRSFNSPDTKDAVYVKLSLLEGRSVFLFPNSTIVQIDIDGLQDSPSYGFFKSNETNLYEILRQIKMVKEDPKFNGIILNINSLNCGMGLIEEVRDAILDLNKTKDSIAYFTIGGTHEYYLASAAKKIVVPPTGYVALTGLAYVVPFYKGVLDKIGIGAQFEQVGKYKAGGEELIQDKISKENKEQLTSIIDDMYERLTDNIAQNRNLTKSTVKEIIDKGLVTPSKAKELGLIDNTAYIDELSSLYPQLPKNIVSVKNSKKKCYSWTIPKIAIVYAEGEIVEGKGAQNFFSDNKVIGAESLSKILKTIRYDDSISAVVLRVNSPGGSVIGSDIILQEIKKLKERHKPIIISMGDIAASGGYFISCNADKILANPGTITGSIGIFFGKLNFENLYNNLNVKHEVIKRGEHADALSLHRALTIEEQEMLQNALKDGYNIFLTRVADGRNKKVEDIDKIAQGRIYTGSQAKDLELVDEIGGLHKAIESAKELAKISDNQKVRLIFYSPEYETNFDDFQVLGSLLKVLSY